MGALANSGIKTPSGAMLIGDKWVSDASGGTYDHIYAGNGKVNATIAMAGAAEIDQAMKAAWKAQREWIAMPVDTRRDLLLKLSEAIQARFDDFNKLNVEDYAVPISMSSAHPNQLIRFLRYYAGWVDKGMGRTSPVSMLNDFNIIEREPYGVIGVIVPWNGPMFGLAMIVAPALAAGNAVVIKPPELAPLTSLLFGEICLQVGLPPGLVNVVPGGPEAGEALVRHPDVRKIHFTGSGATARKITVAAAENLTPVATELGGKGPNIIFADADLDEAVAHAAFQGPLGQSGQSCACGSRILVEDSIYDTFVPRLIATVEAARVGDPFDPQTAVGPVVNETALTRILGVMKSAVDHRMGTLLTGGKRIGGDLADGYFLAPTIFGNVANDTPLARIETFGPVVSVMRFRTEEEAVRIANDTDFGLAAFVHTTNLTRAHRVARQIESGSVYINTFSDISPAAPYGGYKQSGNGRNGGVEGLHEFQQVKTIRIAMP